MATVPQRKTRSGKGEAIADLMLEVAQFFFRIRAVGQRTGSSRAGAAVRSDSCAAWR